MPSPGVGHVDVSGDRPKRVREQVVAQGIFPDVVLDHARMGQMVGMRVIGQCGHEVQRRGEADRTAPDVRREADVVQPTEHRDRPGFVEAAAQREIGLDHVDRARADQALEIECRVQRLAGRDRQRALRQGL